MRVFFFLLDASLVRIELLTRLFVMMARLGCFVWQALFGRPAAPRMGGEGEARGNPVWRSKPFVLFFFSKQFQTVPLLSKAIGQVPFKATCAHGQ